MATFKQLRWNKEPNMTCKVIVSWILQISLLGRINHIFTSVEVHESTHCSSTSDLQKLHQTNVPDLFYFGSNWQLRPS